MNDYKPTPAHAHRQRGRCCKNLCLHCPYFYTTNNLSFEFQAVDHNYLNKAQEILKQAQPQGIASLLLSEAIGHNQTSISVDNMTEFFFFSLKQYVCGILRYVDGKKEIFLLPDFSDQGIDTQMVVDHFTRNENRV